MALRTVITQGDDILTKRARTVEVIDDKIIQLLDDMAETMEAHHGVGLAAPQVGYLKRIFIVDDGTGLKELINPEILEVSGEQDGDEGCLSVPGMVGKVKRPNYVKISGLNRKGERVVYEGTELMARAFCHEYDHLEGKLYVSIARDLQELEE